MAQSYNGWPASSDRGAIGVVSSEWFPGGVKDGDVKTVLRYVAEQMDARVEGIVGGWCWGYNYKANVNNPSSLSCHASGTAIDWNAPDHPNGAYGTFTDEQVGEIYAILNEAEGAVHWLNGDDGGTADAMHFEICVDANTLAGVASRLGTGPKPPPEPDLPNLGEIMFCLVQPNDGSGIYRFNGVNMVGVPGVPANALGGDQIVLAYLGLKNEVIGVDAGWFHTWPKA